MSATTGQHQQSLFISPSNSPAADDVLDATIVKGNDNSIRSKHNDHDNDQTIHFLSGTFASRPAAGTADRKYFSTDSPRRLFIDTGSVWLEVEYVSTSTTNGPDFFTFRSCI